MVQSTVEYGTMLTQVICRGAPVSFLTTSVRKNSARTSAIQDPSAQIAAPLGGLWHSESNRSETTSEDPARGPKMHAGPARWFVPKIPALLDCVLPLQTRPIDCARRTL
ncbi:hypothetical protein NHJ13051_006854 [Beauveria bassiana]